MNGLTTDRDRTEDRPAPIEAPGTAAGWSAARAALWTSVVVAITAPLVAALDLAVPGRTLLALAFVLMVPGVPLAALLRVPNALLSASLAVGLSISVLLLTSAAQVLFGWWHPTATAASVGLLSVVTAAVALERIPGSGAGVSATLAAGGVAVRRWTQGAGRPGAAGRTDRSDRSSWTRPASVALLLVAAASWWVATRQVDLDEAGALGVIGVVGPLYIAALVLVAVVGAVQLTRRTLDGPVLAATAVVLTVVVFGFSNVADGQAGVSVGWLHVGFSRFITENQASFVGLDARAYWPSFFAAGAALVRLAGVDDAATFLSLAPVFYNLAAIAPLLVIARCVTRSRRLAWASVFVYLGGNWFQQDYFSPQATALLLYLVVIAVLLWMLSRAGTPPTTGSWWTRAWQAARRRPALPPGVSPQQSAVWELALLVLAMAVVVSHQLTPVTLVFALLTFTVSGHTQYRRLWLVVSLFFLAWFVYGATDYWVGHLGTVLGDLGNPGGNLDTAVGSRVSGDPTYQVMQNLRMGWSLLYGLAAVAGWWTIRHRREAVPVAGLALGSGALVLLGSYGGEVVLRVFVFAAPVLAPLAVLAVRRGAAPVLRRPGRVRLVAVAAGLLVLALGVTTTRGVNVAFERVTDDDLAAAAAIYDRVQLGDVVGTLAATGALGREHVGEWLPLDMSEAGCGLEALACALAEQPEFIVVSRTQDVVGQLTADRPAGWTTEVADALVDRGLYQVVYQGTDATALQLVEQEG